MIVFRLYRLPIVANRLYFTRYRFSAVSTTDGRIVHPLTVVLTINIKSRLTFIVFLRYNIYIYTYQVPSVVYLLLYRLPIVINRSSFHRFSAVSTADRHKSFIYRFSAVCSMYQVATTDGRLSFILYLIPDTGTKYRLSFTFF